MAFAWIIENLGESDWYLIDRKPYRCPSCNSRNIGKAIHGYPSEEDFFNESLYIIGCIPDPTPVQCKFGCNDCNSKFWKDTPRMRDHLKEVEEFYKNHSWVEKKITSPIYGQIAVKYCFIWQDKSRRIKQKNSYSLKP